MSDLSTDQQIRLDALSLAVKVGGGEREAQTLARAADFAAFITEGTVPETKPSAK